MHSYNCILEDYKRVAFTKVKLVTTLGKSFWFARQSPREDCWMILLKKAYELDRTICLSFYMLSLSIYIICIAHALQRSVLCWVSMTLKTKGTSFMDYSINTFKKMKTKFVWLHCFEKLLYRNVDKV